MAQMRESFFECSLTTPEGRRTAHVRAWTAKEAEDLFRRVLAEEGLAGEGTVVVAAERRLPSLEAVPAQLRH